jgi:NAD(P)-dependent dehydrogenase (short-subunit alcohol dehydrogenase family)
MMTTSSSDIVLITGANQGLGFELARRLASDYPGYHI